MEADNHNSKILIVDDERRNVKVLEALLSFKGYELLLAYNGDECLQIVRENKDVDLILLDIMMPGIDGYEVCRRIKADDTLKDIPVIFLTALADETNELRGFEVGGVDYITKPFKKALLESRVGTQIRLKKATDKIKFYDRLTGLPNQQETTREISRIIGTSKSDECIYLTVIGIYNLKEINDTHGFAFGNKVLIFFASRLKDILDDEDFLGKTGENRFIIISKYHSFEKHEKKLFKILSHFNRKPFSIEEKEVFLTLKVGVSIHPKDAINEQDLLKASSIAIHNIISSDMNVSYFSQELARKAEKQAQMLFHLNKAINNNEFSLFYQPKVNSVDNMVVGAEALIRWNNPEIGLVPPDIFIKLAEKVGLIKDISKWVMGNVALQINKWKKENVPICPVSINLSPYDFKSENFIEEFIEYSKKNKITGDELEIEITEGALVEDLQDVIQKIDALKRMGFRILIDDFGTGYSSLSYLNQFNIDILKIDRSFIKDYPEHDNGDIAKIISNLAAALDMEVVAEGVETKEQLDYMASLGCHIIQGYYYSKPLPADEFTEMMIMGSIIK